MPAIPREGKDNGKIQRQRADQQFADNLRPAERMRDKLLPMGEGEAGANIGWCPLNEPVFFDAFPDVFADLRAGWVTGRVL